MTALPDLINWDFTHYPWFVRLNQSDLGFTRDADTKIQVRRHIRSFARSAGPHPHSLGALHFHHGLDYMEYPDRGSLISVQHYFSSLPSPRARIRTSTRPLTGVLAYPARRAGAPTGALGSLGEALAGLTLETLFGWQLFERPQRTAPDLIMDSGTRFMFVEVKTTARQPTSAGRRRTLPASMMEGALDCLDIWAKELYIYPGPYGTLVVGVYIEDIARSHIIGEMHTLEIVI